MWNVFEQPWALLVAALFVQIVFTVIHMLKPQSRKLWHLLPVAAMVIAAFALDYFVDTDRELVTELVKTGVNSAQEENLAQINQIIAADYSDSRHRTKAELMNTAKAWLSRPLIERNELRGLELKLDQNQAQAMFFVVVHIDKRNDIYGTVPMAAVKTRLTMYKYGKQWLIKNAEILEINNQSFNWGNL